MALVVLYPVMQKMLGLVPGQIVLGQIMTVHDEMTPNTMQLIFCVKCCLELRVGRESLIGFNFVIWICQ